MYSTWNIKKTKELNTGRVHMMHSPQRVYNGLARPARVTSCESK